MTGVPEKAIFRSVTVYITQKMYPVNAICLLK